MVERFRRSHSLPGRALGALPATRRGDDLNRPLLTSTAYGLAVGLTLPEDEIEQARSWLPWWWNDEEVHPELVWHADDAADCESLVSEMELWVAEYARDVIFVHAGVVYVDGRALVFPGRSFAGKSTLVAELVAQGAFYGSDEYAVISGDGLVHPYPRPLTTREDDGSRTRTRIAAAQVGEPGPVSLVAHLHFEPGAVPELGPLSASQSVVRLLDNTVAAQSRADEALSLLATASESATSVVGARWGAEATAGLILELVRPRGK